MENPVRTLEMLIMLLNGATYRNIGEEYGIHKSRVAQLAMWMQRMLLDPDILKDTVIKKRNCSLKDMRKERDSWLILIERMKKRHET